MVRLPALVLRFGLLLFQHTGSGYSAEVQQVRRGAHRPAHKPLVQDHITWIGRKRAPMSDCLHCEIHDMLEVHLEADHADLAEIAAKVTEVLADLILMVPPDEPCMMLANIMANLGGMVLEKSKDADPNSPRRSSH